MYVFKLIGIVIAGFGISASTGTFAQAALPLFDAHIHYSHDA